MVGLVLADVYGIASLVANAVALSLAALLLISVGLRDSTSLRAWMPEGRAKHHSAMGSIEAMAIRVDGAAEGYAHSREDIANLLAVAFAVKSGQSLRPGYELRMEARETLKGMTRDDPSVARVLEPHLQGERRRLRRRKDYDYLSGLEAAIRIVREGN